MHLTLLRSQQRPKCFNRGGWQAPMGLVQAAILSFRFDLVAIRFVFWLELEIFVSRSKKHLAVHRHSISL